MTVKPIIIGLCMLGTTTLVQAAPHRSDHYASHQQQGRVLETKPLYKEVRVPVRQKRCVELSGSRHHKSGRQECKLVAHYEIRRKLSGYRVKYEYRGRIYWTETKYQPGRFIAHSRHRR